MSSRLLRWQAIREDEIDGTVWAEMRDAGTRWVAFNGDGAAVRGDVSDQLIVLDSATLDKLFVNPRPKKLANANAAKQKQKQLSAGVLDRQRNTNIEIGLRRIKLPTEQMLAAVLTWLAEVTFTLGAVGTTFL